MTKRVMIAAILLAGCPPTEPNRPRCAYGEDHDGGCNPDPYAPVAVPELRRVHTVESEKTIDGFDVAAIPGGATGWKIRVTNNGDTVASVVWDESTFVTSDGQSAGRLISGSTRKIDTAKSQPPTPVAPHANVTEFVIPEKFIDNEELEAKIATDGQIYPRQVAVLNKARAAIYKMIVGGKLYVTVQGAVGKQTWSGIVVPPREER